MSERIALPHGRAGATQGLWREGDTVLKLLRSTGPASEVDQDWNYWWREPLAYEEGLPQLLGLDAPRFVDCAEDGDGGLWLRLEFVHGRSGGELRVSDLGAAAHALGRAQGAPSPPSFPWLSKRFLRDYSGTREVDWSLLEDDTAWAAAAPWFDAGLRAGLVRLRERREWLLGIMESLPRTVCHLDVWPHNLVVRPSGSVAFLDWAFCGDGALGEDIGNLVPDGIYDSLLDWRELDVIELVCVERYLDGLREAGCDVDPRVVRLGICASAVKYDWLAPLCLAEARCAVGDRRAYGGAAVADPDERLAARAAGLALCVRWADEAERLMDTGVTW